MDSKKLFIGTKLYVVDNKIIKQGYLYSLTSPILSIFTTLNLPAFPIFIDLFNELINSVNDVVSKVDNFDVSEFLSASAPNGAIKENFPPVISNVLNFDKLYKLIDFKALGLLAGKNLTGIELKDVNSLLLSMCKVIVPDTARTTKLINAPTSLVFLTRSDAEAYLKSTGVKCLVCNREFEKMSDINKSLICVKCYDDIKNSIMGAFDYTISNDIVLKMSMIKSIRKKEFSLDDGESLDSYLARMQKELEDAYGKELKSKEIVLASTKISDNKDTTTILHANTILPGSSGIYFNPSDKRQSLIHDIFLRYQDYLDGKFDPNTVPLVATKDISNDDYVNILVDANTIDLQDPNTKTLYASGVPAHLTLKFDNITDVNNVKTIKVFVHNETTATEGKLVQSLNNTVVRGFYSDLTVDVKSKKFLSEDYEMDREFIISHSDISIGNNIVVVIVDYYDRALPTSDASVVEITNTNNRISNNVEFVDKQYLNIKGLEVTTGFFDKFIISENFKMKITGTLVAKATITNVYDKTKKYNIESAVDVTDTNTPHKTSLDLSKIFTSRYQTWDFSDESPYIVNVSYNIPNMGTVLSYNFVLFNANVDARVVGDFIMNDMEEYNKTGISKNSINKRFYIDDKQHKFTTILRSNRNVIYHKMGVVFFFNGEEVYYDVVKVEGSTVSKYTDDSRITFSVKFPTTRLTDNGKYTIKFYPIYTLEDSVGSVSVSASKFRSVLSGKSLENWRVADPSNSKWESGIGSDDIVVNLTNVKTAQADTELYLNFNIDKMYSTIKKYGSKVINDRWGTLSDKEYTKEIIKYGDGVLGSLLSIVKKTNIAGINKVEVLKPTNGDGYFTGSSYNRKPDRYVRIKISYVNVPNERKSFEYSGDYVHMSNLIDNGEFFHMLNESVKKKFSDLQISPIIESKSGLNKFINMDCLIDVTNSSKISLTLNDDVWITVPLFKSPVHLIFRGILTDIHFKDIVGVTSNSFKYAEANMLNDMPKAEILINPVPAISATTPPMIPIVPLVPTTVDMDKVYSTFKEARDSALWYFCPVCQKFKKPTDKNRAKKMMEFAKDFSHKVAKDAAEWTIDFAMLDNVEDKIENYKKDSNVQYEEYKNVSNKFVEEEQAINKQNAQDEIFNEAYSDSDNNELTDFSGNKSADGAWFTFSDDTLTTLETVNDATETFHDNTLTEMLNKGILNTGDSAITKSSDSIKQSQFGKAVANKTKALKNTIKSGINVTIAATCDALNVDTVDLDYLMKTNELSGSVKICPECQNKIAEIFGDIVEYLRDLFLDGIYDLEFVTKKYIDVAFSGDTNQFEKFIFEKPVTEDERVQVVKLLTEMLDSYK